MLPFGTILLSFGMWIVGSVRRKNRNGILLCLLILSLCCCAQVEPPLDLQQVTRLATSTSDDRFASLVRSRGVGFYVTDEFIQELLMRGATVAKCRVLLLASRPEPERPSPPPAPEPIVVVETGTIQIICAPAECDIKLNDESRGRTSGGTSMIESLNPGPAMVELSKHDPLYVTKVIPVTVKSKLITTVTVDLEPTQSTREAFGRAILERALRALGSKAALDEVRSISALGQMKVVEANGLSTDYSLTFEALLPSHFLFRIYSPNGRRATIVYNVGSADHPVRLRGFLPPSVLSATGLFRDFHLPTLFNSFGSMGLTVSAERPDRDGVGLTFSVKSSMSNTSIKLDQHGLPQSASRELNGIGLPEEVGWGDYAVIGTAKYPKSVLVKFSPDGRAGAQFHFRLVQLAPNLKEGEFK